MSRLRVRWATGPDDAPAEGEALARPVTGPLRHEHYPGAGRHGTDLSLARARALISVETADGRRLVTGFRPDSGAPEADDLIEAWRDAWQQGSAGGRPRHDPSPDVIKYAREVDRRIADREPTDIKLVAQLMGWNPRTVRRHVKADGFRDWPDFVEDRRSIAKRASD